MNTLRSFVLSYVDRQTDGQRRRPTETASIIATREHNKSKTSAEAERFVIEINNQQADATACLLRRGNINNINNNNNNNNNNTNRNRNTVDLA